MSDNLYENIKTITAEIISLAGSNDEPNDNLYDNVKLICKNLKLFAIKNEADINELEKTIEVLQKTKNELLYFNSRYDFPNIGDDKTIYVDISTNLSYRFDKARNNYIIFASNLYEIKTIDGNGGMNE